jgi:hypothetical protein
VMADSTASVIESSSSTLNWSDETPAKFRRTPTPSFSVY